MVHRRWACFVAIVLLVTAAARAQSIETPEERLELMEATIGDFAARSEAVREEGQLRFRAKPLLRYSDPTRGLRDTTTLADATVWRLGESGRPRAIVTLEIYRSAESASLAYEFASLTAETLELKQRSQPQVAWTATGNSVELRSLKNGPAPAKTAAGRLVQMRELARRFRVRETIQDDIVECRLLSQPIDRYQNEDQGIVDGAIFAFANGTNPEVGLLLETDGKAWTYGGLRLSAAASAATLDGEEVFAFSGGDFALVREGAYISTSRPLDLPPK